MYQLQQLHREFNIAQATAPQLDLTLFFGCRNVVGHPAAHGLDRLHKALTSCGCPDQRFHGLLVALTEFLVAGNGPRLQQCLELPTFGPPGVIAQVRGKGANQRPGLSFRTKIGVDFPQAWFRRRRGDRPGDTGREGGAYSGRACVVHLPCLDDVDDIDVGNVVQLPGAALTHANDGKPDVCDLGCVELGCSFRPGYREGGLNGSTGEICQLGTNCRHEVRW
ncbi:hypothetical protein D3C73_1011100 [compost metagenome]